MKPMLCYVMLCYDQSLKSIETGNVVLSMAGETEGDREGPSAPGPINSITWVEPGWTQNITKMGPFYFSWTVFQLLQYFYRWFLGPLRHLETLFLGGLQGLVPLHLWNDFSSPGSFVS